MSRNFNASLRRDTSFSYPVDSPLLPPPFPVSFSRLSDGTDPNWVCHTNSYSPEHARKSQTHVKYALPRAGQVSVNVLDEWISPAQDGEKFTNEGLGWVVDQWPQGVANYRPESTFNTNLQASEKTKRALYGLLNTNHGIWEAPSWFPTLTMDFEVKKQLPSEGVEWLFVRAVAKQIKDGRMDVEVIVMDEGMELVALSHHVCLVIAMAPKGGKEAARGKDDSKL